MRSNDTDEHQHGAEGRGPEERGSDNPGSPRGVHACSTEWLKGQGHLCDVVLSSRVRLARNIEGFPFPPTAETAERLQTLEIVRRCMHSIAEEGPGGVRWIDLRSSPALERRLLVERQIMSRQHAQGRYTNGSGGNDVPRGVAVYEPEERVSVLVNEEDHLRIQVLKTGLSLAGCLGEANAIDDLIESRLEYAFSPRYGYLTACPTNVGTGLRLSVMVHLPALKITGELEKVRNAASDMGLAVRGIYGEGSEAAGGLFQISNQVTLGKSDEMILREIETQVIPMIVRYEQHARAQLMKNQRVVIEDRVQRSLGTLRHARLIKSDEAMEELGNVRLGVLCSLVENVKLSLVHELMLAVQPGHLQARLGRELTQGERRRERAALLREQLGG